MREGGAGADSSPAMDMCSPASPAASLLAEGQAPEVSVFQVGVLHRVERAHRPGL